MAYLCLATGAPSGLVHAEQGAFAEEAFDEVDRKFGRHVAVIECRVELDDVEEASRPVSATISMQSWASR